MDECPVCNSVRNEGMRPCECGYDFEAKEIKNCDKEKIRSFVGKYERSMHWSELVQLKLRIYDVQIIKHGGPTTKKDSGWSIRKTAGLLGESHPNSSIDISLARSLNKYPELKVCKTKDEARKKAKAITSEQQEETFTEPFQFEIDLQKYLFQNWDKTRWYREWKIHSEYKYGKIRLDQNKEIDILAKHRIENRWLVIELKKLQSSDETVGQVLRYMGWVKENLAGEDGRVEGVIISNTADVDIRLALKCVQNIELEIYRLKNGAFRLEKYKDANLRVQLLRMTQEERKALLDELEKK